MASQSQQEEAKQAAEGTTTDPAVLAAAGSVMLSWYFFFIRGDRERGLFVGLWPPTIFAFVSYFNQTEMSRQLRRASQEKNSVADSVQRLIENR